MITVVASKTPEELRAIAVAQIPAPWGVEFAKGYASAVRQTLIALEEQGFLASGTAKRLWLNISSSMPIVESGALLLSVDGDMREGFAAMQTDVRTQLASRAEGKPQ